MNLEFGERFAVSQIKSVTNYNPEYKKLYKFPGRLPTYELMYFYQGDVLMEFGGKTFRVKAGDMVFLPKGIENNRYCITSDERFGLFCVYFDTDDGLPTEAVHMPHSNIMIKTIFESMHRTWQRKGGCYYLKTMQLLYEMLQLVAKNQGIYTGHKYDSVLAKVEEYMMAHFCDRDFDYDCLAEASGFSYSFFKKIFIAKYGMQPNKYITQIRLNYACELLNTHKYKIAQVAQMCGYENVYYFSNVFKKHKGMSPKNYSV